MKRRKRRVERHNVLHLSSFNGRNISPRELTAYTAGSYVNIGQFDIADIALVSPVDDATVALPYTFEWTPRTVTPNDVYEFDLCEPAAGSPYFYTNPPLGYVRNYILNSLPIGFNVTPPYVWEVWVYSPDGAYGISLKTLKVRFSNTGLSITEARLPLQSQANSVKTGGEEK